MGDEILKKIDLFTSDSVDEVSVYSVGNPDYPKVDYEGVRPIQFMKWWNKFRPGDRVDVMFGEEFISMAGTNAEGHFAGAKKELEIDDPSEMMEFKEAEGDIWNFV